MIFGIEGMISGAFNKEKNVTQQNVVENVNKDVTSGGSAAQASSQTTAGTRQQAGISDISTLDPEVQKLLMTLMERSAGPGAEQDLVNFIQSRATGGDAAIGGDIEKILAASRLSGERGITQRATAGASRAGSGFNTLVRAQAGRDIAGLETQLAGVAGELGLSGRRQVSEELMGAVGARGASTANLTALANVLKGAQTRGVSQELGREETSTASLLASIQQMLESTRSKSHTSSVGQSVTKGFQLAGQVKGGISV